MTTYEHDPASVTPRTITRSTPLDRTATVELDDFGRPITAQQADLAPVSLSYDDQGRLELLVEGEVL